MKNFYTDKPNMRQNPSPKQNTNSIHNLQNRRPSPRERKPLITFVLTWEQSLFVMVQHGLVWFVIIKNQHETVQWFGGPSGHMEKKV